MLRRFGHPCGAPSSAVGRAEEVSLSSPPPPPAGGVGSYNHHSNAEEDGVEASVVVCEPLKPPRLCHAKISQKCVKQQPKNERAVRARCYARCARCVCFPQRPKKKPNGWLSRWVVKVHRHHAKAPAPRKPNPKVFGLGFQ